MALSLQAAVWGSAACTMCAVCSQDFRLDHRGRAASSTVYHSWVVEYDLLAKKAVFDWACQRNLPAAEWHFEPEANIHSNNKQIIIKCVICYSAVCRNASQSNLLVHASHLWPVTSYSCRFMRYSTIVLPEGNGGGKKGRPWATETLKHLCCLYSKQHPLFFFLWYYMSQHTINLSLFFKMEISIINIDIP